MLQGEIAYREADYPSAWAYLEEAIERCDNLAFSEPWPWMQPPRHAYGALLLEQGLVERAAEVYAQDLGIAYADPTGGRTQKRSPRALQHPKNIWALQGYQACLQRLGRDREAEEIKPQLEEAKSVADVDVGVSCYCARQPGGCY